MKIINLGLTKYPIAMIDMEMACENVYRGEEECIFITQHEALYSAGKSFEAKDFIAKPQYPVYFPKRGGRVTVHAPGQLVIYPIINLRKRNLNVSSYVATLEDWIINALQTLGIESRRSEEGVGVWIKNSKVGFIGVRIEHGVSSHGLCLNVSNDLSMFLSIIPCGINNVKITSLKLAHNSPLAFNSVVNAFITTLPF